MAPSANSSHHVTSQEVAYQLTEKTKREVSTADVARMCERNEFSGAYKSVMAIGTQDEELWRIPQSSVNQWLARNGFTQTPFYKKGWVRVSATIVFLAALFGSLADGLDVVNRVMPVPTVTPTPLPFAPAADGETMIVILPFHSTAANNSEPHKKIWRRIQELLTQKMPNGPVTAVIDPNTVLTADQQAQAEIVGKRHNASMVIWGEDTGVELIASFLNLREPDFAAADVDIQETQRTQLANPSQYAEFVTRELPGQLAFLALFAVGQTYYLDSDYPSAIDTIESAIAEVSSPNDQGTADQATELSKGLAEAYYRLGWLHQQAPVNLDAAIADYTKAIALDPKYVYAYGNRGVAYAAKGEFDQAIADYIQFIALDPKDARAYNNRGAAYAIMGQLDQAIADLNQAIALDPENPDAYINRGGAYAATGELGLAIADFNQAIALDPENPNAYINRGVAYAAKGELDQVIADYTQGIALDPKIVNAYYNRGVAYAAKGELDKAVADYTQVIVLDPQFASAYINRGAAYAIMGQLDQAIADLDRAIALDPENTDAYYNRGGVYAANGELGLAIADYTQVIALDPKDARAYNERGRAYYFKSELGLAIADFNQAIALDPKDALVYNERGRAYYFKGELDQAIADFNQAITLDPEYTDAYANRGGTYYAKGELDQAITDYTHAIALDPQYIPAHNGRGLAYSAKGEFAQAIADFQISVDWLAEHHPDQVQLIEQTRSWIESLTRGDNPFTPAVLEELRKQQR